MEYYLGILNRTYQIFVTPTTIAGAFVNGVVSAPLGLPYYWFEPATYARKELKEKYEEVSPYSDNFKEPSRFFNFQYQRAEIEKAWYVPTRKWGMGTVAHSGKLNIKFSSGRKREFILLGLQQGKEIVHHLMKNPASQFNSDDYSEVHAILKQLYANPQSLEEWAILAELFLDLGEKAQEYYCSMYIRQLMVFERNGG